VPPVAVVPNGVDVEAFRPASADERVALRHEFGLSLAPMALSVGRLEASKGVHLAVEAWRDVTGGVEGAQLVIVGDGDRVYVERLRARAGVDGLGRSIRVLGSRDRQEVARLMRTADVFLFPTLVPEGMPTVVLEAMASGTPVVGHEFSARSEMASPEQGLVVAGADEPGALAREITGLLADPLRRGALGRSVRAVAEANFSQGTYLSRQGDFLVDRVRSTKSTCRPWFRALVVTRGAASV
jgi:glycosyltransferase involved in cell wall biosynthesis